ncbi:hypothetical protein JM18_002506 [Phytophthora kernoviae]|uniref:glucan endo-1,3-beta-D-glucosidase n=1 Tax=Phytophthora kernoviae TaxID=325452 RepID=A0A922AR55_9STRA|nr:hypothetical protein JM18_002506 [Phytophthora kernoviae]
MVRVFLALSSALAVAAQIAVTMATSVSFVNDCTYDIHLYDNNAAETISVGSSTSRNLADGFSGMFRNGMDSEATLAQFAINGSKSWYSISAVPPGAGNCISYEDCAKTSGKTGYNVAMSITPDIGGASVNPECAAVTCASTDCDGAYLYPTDDSKLRNCPDNIAIEVAFCPGGSSNSTATPTTPTEGTVAPPVISCATAAPTVTPAATIPSNGVNTRSSYEYRSADAGSATGYYGKITDMLSCSTEEVCVTDPVGPMSEEVTIVFRGPMDIYNIAVFAGSSGRDWTKVSAYDSAAGTQDNMIFMNNRNIDYSGANSSPQGYSTSDGAGTATESTIFGGTLADASNPSAIGGGPCVSTGCEINILTATNCAEGGGCIGYYDDLGFHGWGGGMKMFVTKVMMPTGSTVDMPAIWMLNAQVVRANQYGCNCRGMGAKGGCGELDVAEVIGNAHDKISTHYYFYDGSVSPGHDNYAERPTDSAVTYVTIFDNSGDGVIKIIEIGEDERKKRSINEMFGDEDSGDSDDDQVPRATATTTADASGLFGSDSDSDDEEDKPAKRPASPTVKRVKKERREGAGGSPTRRREEDEYDSGEEAMATKEDDDFIDGDDDLADVLGEYDQDQQQFDDERPLDEPELPTAQKLDFFDETLKSLKTGRARSKVNLSPQEMEQITQEVLYRMDKAYADDLASIEQRRPALEKIKFMDSALHILRKLQFQPMLLDFDLLTIVKKWIQPLENGTLPNVGLRTKMLDMVSKMPVFKEHLKRSGLGKVVMILMKHPQETLENKELCRSLVERWSRSVFNKTLDFSKLAELEAEKAENAVYRRRERIMVSKQMRRHQTAGGQATGAEGIKSSKGRTTTLTKFFEKTQAGKRGCTLDEAELTDGEDEDAENELDEDGSSLQFPIRLGNQLGELATDSERVFPAPSSHVASLNRELKALETRYYRTRLHLEKSTEKNDHLRREMKKLTANNAKLEREIFKLRHLIDRIQSDRKQLELQAISNRDYAKKIEHRFFMGTKGQSLAQCNLELSSRLRALEQTLKKKEEALEQSQQEGEDAREKLGIVQHALETRLESYELNGSLHTGLLFEISQLQDHGEAMALQLAQERKQMVALGTQLKKAQKHEEDLEDARTVRETWVATLEKERAALDEKLAQLASDAQTAACEKASLLRFIHEQAEAKFQVEARLKDEQAQRRQEFERAQHAQQLWEEEKQKLKANLQTAQQETARQRDNYEQTQITLQEQREVNSTLQTRGSEMNLDLERLEAARKKSEEDFLAAKDVCRELQSTVEQHEENGRLLRSEIDTLETTRRDLLGQLETKRTEELALRQAMEGALQDLAALSRQRNDAAKAMSEAVTISASSLEEQQTLEHQVETQRSQIEKLKNSKNLLQNAMLEQLAALRKQLHVERRQRIEAEARLKHMRPLPVSAATDDDLSPVRTAPSVPISGDDQAEAETQAHISLLELAEGIVE